MVVSLWSDSRKDTPVQMIDFILHVNKYLDIFVDRFGPGVYAVLFLVIFAETGLVVAPFLPGDSLLFAAGMFAAQGTLSLPLLLVLFFAAAVIGDNVNYVIGKALGQRVCKEGSRILKRKYLDQTNAFFEKHGGKTIVLARFVPIVRTFAPFVAGAGSMHFPRFFAFNLFGGVVWVGGFTLLGYFLGDLVPEKYFTLAVLIVIAVSVMPGFYHFAQHRLEAGKAAKKAASGSACE